jgi:hypothetical protein
MVGSVAMTARQIVNNALQEIGVLAQGETANADDAAAALTILQRLVDSLGAERQAIFQILRTVKALTSGTRDYTIGTGGDINIVRPAYIDAAAVILDSTATIPIELAIEVFSDAQWEGIRLKTFAAGVVSGIYYDRADAAGLATISTFPTINIANVQLVIYTPKALVGFVDLTTDYVFPPGYADAFHYELAYRLQRPFGKPADPQIEKEKGDAWARVKRANLSLSELALDPMFAGQSQSWYDIQTDY